MIGTRHPATAELTTAIAFAIFAGVATALFSYISMGNTSGSAAISYLGYVVIAGCIIVGLRRPVVAVLSAFILLAINPGYAIAHTFTSAPSDYLIIVATCSLIVRRSFNIRQIHLPLVAASLLAAMAILALAIAASGNYAAPLNKFLVAECIGIASMGCYIVAPALALQCFEHPKNLLRALALGGIVLFAVGLVGGIDTLTCTTTGTNEMFTSAGFRDKGFLGDPNLLGTYVAVLLPLVVLAVRKIGLPWAFAAAWVGVVLIVLSGSRTGIATGCIAAALSLCFVNRTRWWMLPVCGSTIVWLAIAPGFAWSKLPCPLNAPDDRVMFNERNADGVYYARAILRINGAEKLLAGSATLRDMCLTDSDKTVPLNVVAAQPRIRDCILLFLTKSFREPNLQEESYKQIPAVTALLNQTHLDSHRRLLWVHALAIGIENPLFGIGPSNMTLVTPRNWRSHNTLLTTFAEQGLVGIGLLLAALATAILAGARALRGMSPSVRGIFLAALVGIAVCLVAGLSQDMMRQPLGWALIGFFAAGGHFDRRERPMKVASLPAE